jgi:sulfate permease, SulP family
VRLLPGWLTSYRRGWLVPDVLAGVIVWSVVVPQACAYAQIAGLPPSAGLAAAPGALLAYALLGTSRSLVVSATTATSALSAAAVGPLTDGDGARFAALSAALALVAGAVLVVAGLAHAGKLMDFVPKTVMTGFLFGLGLVVALGQLPKVFGVAGGGSDFFEQLEELLRQLDDTNSWTLAVGLGSAIALVAFQDSRRGFRARSSFWRGRSSSRPFSTSRPRAWTSWASCPTQPPTSLCPTWAGEISSISFPLPWE